MSKTDNYVALPLDTGNTGKKVRTKESVVGANTVEEYFFIPSSERQQAGNYKFTVGAQAIPSAVQNGTGTGLMYLINPLSSGVNVSLDTLTLKHNFTTTVAADSIAPVLRLSRFTFTGTLTASAITPAKRKAADAAAQALLSSAMTGLTITLGAAIYEWIGMVNDSATGTGGHWLAQTDTMDTNGEDDEIVLVPGEGIVLWSTFAVTTANRKIAVNGTWKEWT